MKTFKHLLILSLLTFNVSLFACWFTEENFNKTYIAGVNHYFEHYRQSGSLIKALYCNNMTVSSPLNVLVCINPISSDNPISEARLQWKYADSTQWRTLTVLTTPFTSSIPLPLFDLIIFREDEKREIVIRLYVTDGINESGDLSVDIPASTVTDFMDVNSPPLPGGWTPPFVMKVKLSGKRRPF